jgi:hypothetical protein
MTRVSKMKTMKYESMIFESILYFYFFFSPCYFICFFLNWDNKQTKKNSLFFTLELYVHMNHDSKACAVLRPIYATDHGLYNSHK